MISSRAKQKQKRVNSNYNTKMKFKTYICNLIQKKKYTRKKNKITNVFVAKWNGKIKKLRKESKRQPAELNKIKKNCFLLN